MALLGAPPVPPPEDDSSRMLLLLREITVSDAALLLYPTWQGVGVPFLFLFRLLFLSRRRCFCRCFCRVSCRGGWRGCAWCRMSMCLQLHAFAGT